MKKITLLIIAAIFAVGIQGCSKDDNVFEGEKVTNTEVDGKNLLIPIDQPETILTVFYPKDMPESKRNSFRNQMRGQIFSTLLIYGNNSCGTKETWSIDKYSLDLFNTSGFAISQHGSILTEGKSAMQVTSSGGEETALPGRLISKDIIGDFIFKLYEPNEIPPHCNPEDVILGDLH